MRYVPTSQELQDVDNLSSAQRLQYFLSRVFEVEEIWSLADTQGWVMQEDGDKTLLSLWPYREFAEACRLESDLHTQATSLDHFFERILQILVAENIHVNILPGREGKGAVISAHELKGMFTSLMESGEYFLEG